MDLRMKTAWNSVNQWSKTFHRFWASLGEMHSAFLQCFKVRNWKWRASSVGHVHCFLAMCFLSLWAFGRTTRFLRHSSHLPNISLEHQKEAFRLRIHRGCQQSIAMVESVNFLLDGFGVCPPEEMKGYLGTNGTTWMIGSWDNDNAKLQISTYDNGNKMTKVFYDVLTRTWLWRCHFFFNGRLCHPCMATGKRSMDDAPGHGSMDASFA